MATLLNGWHSDETGERRCVCARLSPTSAHSFGPHRPTTLVHIGPQPWSTSARNLGSHRPATLVHIGPQLWSTSARNLGPHWLATLVRIGSQPWSTSARNLGPHRPAQVWLRLRSDWRCHRCKRCCHPCNGSRNPDALPGVTRLQPCSPAGLAWHIRACRHAYGHACRYVYSPSASTCLRVVCYGAIGKLSSRRSKRAPARLYQRAGRTVGDGRHRTGDAIGDGR